MSEELVPYRAGPPANADPAVWQAMDGMQEGMRRMDQAVIPVRHSFTGSAENGTGIYARTVVMPAHTRVMSEVHLTEHPFVITRGRVWVGMADGTSALLEAPFHGVTKPGTRRLLLVEEETEWTTYHATPLTDPEEIGRQILLQTPCPGLPQPSPLLPQPTEPIQPISPKRLDHEPSEM